MFAFGPHKAGALADEPMHPVLNQPELLSLTFSLGLVPSSILHAALVCQAWREPALDLLWRDLKSAMPLLQLLGHLIEHEDNKMVGTYCDFASSHNSFRPCRSWSNSRPPVNGYGCNCTRVEFGHLMRQKIPITWTPYTKL